MSSGLDPGGPDPGGPDPGGPDPGGLDPEALTRFAERSRAAAETVRRSARYRIGDAIAEAARSPRGAFRLPRQVVRLLREARHRAGPAALPETRPDPTMPAPLPPGAPPLRPVVLFFAINGVGLGHLTRCLAIARRLEALTPVFVTTCRRAHVLDAYGIRYHALPSADELVAGGLVTDPAAWNEMLYMHLASLYDAYRPAALVLDGTAAYDGLIAAWRLAPEVGRVGIRRAYRLDGRERRILARDREFHRILVPHEEGSEDVPLPDGPAARWVGPLLLVDREEALPREEARRALGIPAGGPAVLVQLGAGVLGRGREVERDLVAGLAGHGVHALVTRYDPAAAAGGGNEGPPDEAPGAALGAAPGPPSEAAGRVILAHRYPMAAYAAAFDVAVAAAGYNTFTELLHHGVPTIFVPNPAAVSDDQVARARAAAESGAALCAEEGDGGALRATVQRTVADPALRGRLSERARAFVPRNGAVAAAREIERFCDSILARSRSRDAPRADAG